MEQLHSIEVWLADVHPALPWILMVFVLWASQYLVRRYLPNVWEACANVGPFGGIDLGPTMRLARKAWQASPSVILGAIIAAIATKMDVKMAALGAAAGCCAPVLHEFMKAAPWFPYRGETRTGKLPLSSLLILIAMPGCAPARSLPPPCPAIEKLTLEGKLAQVKAGCDDDPLGECPELVAEYDAKIEAVPDEACP